MGQDPAKFEGMQNNFFFNNPSLKQHNFAQIHHIWSENERNDTLIIALQTYHNIVSAGIPFCVSGHR